ncbi:EAL domain-containing protein [Alicyclobacillus tolerans]|uniref:putative bifunctional diguanylate cyclase/phosphodiesterase n=1 Tax=Alicyclobacillus tolerans TaxID=90970 RepID=UPI001F1CD34E|nr:EAL domain-containing protein [Alicyclobacillus tolerans]MCF8563157.1 EAL domain-containing protein [Alicyclobacillus tolerans]
MTKHGLDEILSNATLVLNSIEEGIYATDEAGVIIYSNPTAARILGYSVEEMLGQPAHDLFRHSRSDGSHLARHECEHHRLLVSGGLVDVLDDVFWKKDGTSIPVEFTSTAIHKSGKVAGIVVAFKDITRRKKVESRLLHQNQILEMIAAGKPLAEILGFLAEIIEHQTDAECSIVLAETGNTLLDTGIAPLIETCVPSRTPSSSVPILSTEHSVLGTLTVNFPERKQLGAEDLSLLESYAHLAGIAIQRDRAEREIHHLAYHDSLTGLYNRRWFMVQAEQAISEAKKNSGSIAVMLIDLDRFKWINDSLGHNFGDLVLKVVAERLKSVMMPSQFAARMGGDEFLILIDRVPSVTGVLEPANALIEVLNQPIVVDDRTFRLTASTGIAFYPQDGADLDTLIRQADRAMYHAKEMGGNGLRLYQALNHDQYSTHGLLETQLQQALDEGQLYLEFQPKMNVDSGRMTGAEALVRWQHPELGVVSPGDFIAIAEETGLIRPLDSWVLQTVCRQMKDWKQRGVALVPIAVNLSTAQFQQPDLVPCIQRLLDAEELDSYWLEIEITETTLMRSEQKAMEKLKLLRDMGIRVSIDDFGVGYSCLGLLQHLMVDSLKIDKAFVKDIDPQKAAIVSTIVQLGHSLQLKVVAEGVETVEQRQFIHEQGCDEMQGFLLSRPLSASAFEQFVLQSTLAPLAPKFV